MKKYIILAAILALATPSWAKRISEYDAVDAFADADKILLSDTSASGREKTVTGSALKTYIGTNVAFILRDLSDLKIDIGSTDEDLISASPADKDLQTYTATQIDTLLSTAGSAPTIQSADPTAASANGWYLATGSGDLFYVSDGGTFTIAGAYSAWDTSPTAFTFTDETDIALSTAKVSDTKTLAGIDRTAAISVTGDAGYGYKKNGGACTATSGTIALGDTFNACVTSSGSYSTATTATVTIGGVSDVYSVTTLAAAIPTLSSRTIGTNGTTLTLVGSESLSVGGGGNGGFDVDCSTAGSNITATYSSGAPGSSLVYTLGTTVNSGDTCDLDYTQPGNGIEATTGGGDLASITSGAITNNSTQGGSTLTDDFSASGNLTSPWSKPSGLATYVQGSSGAAVSASDSQKARAVYVSTLNDNQYAQVLSKTLTGYSRGPCVRMDANGVGYYLAVSDNGTVGSVGIYKVASDGGYTAVGSAWTFTTGTGNNKTYKITASSTTLKAYVDGVERISTTDSSYTSGYSGIMITSGNAASGIESFEAGNL